MWLPNSLPSFHTPPPAERSPLELAVSPSGLSNPYPTTHTLPAESTPSGHNKGHGQLHQQAKLPFPQPQQPHSGPQACRRAASLCRSQHTEYLMSDERFHLLTQAEWQNNAVRDTAASQSPLQEASRGGPACLSPKRSHPQGAGRRPHHHQHPPPLSLAREFLA